MLRGRTKTIILAVFAVLVIAGAVTGGLIYKSAHDSPVPKSIAKQVDFPIYYPAQKQLPKGYTLSKTSFKSPQSGVVVYAVTYGNGKRLVFSVQKKPSDDELASFVKTYIPIHREALTLVGKATIGSLNNRTVVSIPTDSGTWILVTGPPEAYGTDALSKTLKALTY
jgi:hypothetical protein